MDKQIQLGITELLEISEPQENCFIGTFNLCRNYKDWKEDVLGETGSPSVRKMLQHFESNVTGRIISESDLPEDLQGDFDVETPYPVQDLEGGTIDIPENTKFCMLLPVDYNRGSDDIGIVFMTEEGRDYYAHHITGDY